jgi:hypothetical protein
MRGSNLAQGLNLCVRRVFGEGAAELTFLMVIGNCLMRIRVFSRTTTLPVQRIG